MDWNDIRLIIEIARCGSFTGAAAVLGTSKPTISRSIARIEQKARARIFRRTPQGATLTEAGERLIVQAVRVEDEVLDFERILKSLGKDSSRLVSVRMSEGVAAYLVGPVLAGQDLGPLGIEARRQGISLPPIRTLAPSDPGRADISLVWTPAGGLPDAKQNDKVRKLADISFVPFITQSYRGVAPPTRFDRMGDCQLVTMSSYRWFSDDGWAAWHRVVDANPNTIESAWTCSVGQFILSGRGIGLLPSYVPLYADSLGQVGIAAPPMIASVWMVWDQDIGADPLVRNCLDALGRLFTKADWWYKS